MIRYLRGRIRAKIRQQVVLEVAGVGYGLRVPLNILASMRSGEDCQLYVSEAIREDAYELFGFLELETLEIFELLRRVSGVGPKLALAIIGFYASPDLRAIINFGDVNKLSLVTGVGKKLADKIVVELRDRTAAPTPVDVPGDQDVVVALQSLGYTNAEIADVLPKIPGTLTSPEDRLAWLLRHLGE